LDRPELLLRFDCSISTWQFSCFYDSTLDILAGYLKGVVLRFYDPYVKLNSRDIGPFVQKLGVHEGLQAGSCYLPIFFLTTG